MEELKIDHRRRNSDASDVSFLSHRSMDPPPLRFKRGRNRSVVKKSRFDAELINPGPPAVYQLNTERKYIDGTDDKVRRWTYGRRDRNKQNKVLLMVGETGAGKTTLINTMINYILGVKFEDQEWYQITEEEKQDDQTQSQTSEVTVYEVFVEENPTSLTIIDTPGYTNTKGFKREREISEYLGRLFSAKDGVCDIDAVCFVMKASQNRLSGKELYIFHAVLSLFGKDIKDNIVFLFTHSDGGPPTDALNAIEKAEIPCRRDGNEPVHFLFSNRQKDKRNKHDEEAHRSAWETGERSVNTLLKILEDNNRTFFQIKWYPQKEKRDKHDEEAWETEKRRVNTLLKILEDNRIFFPTSWYPQKEKRDKRNEQTYNSAWETGEISEDTLLKIQEEFTVPSEIDFGQLEARISNLKERISEKELKVQELTDIQKALTQNRDQLEKGENFVFTLREVVNKQVDTWFRATTCKTCRETCHSVWGCWWVSTDELYKCDVMEDGHCTVCSGKCHYSKHVKEKKIYKKEEQTVSTSLNDLKRKYECDGKQIEEKLTSELRKTETQSFILLNEAYLSFMILSEVPLNGTDFTPEHVDFFIRRMKEEGDDKRTQDLEDVRKLIQVHANTLLYKSKVLLKNQYAKCTQIVDQIASQGLTNFLRNPRLEN